MFDNKRKKIVVVASGGGHWIQLTRLRAAFEGCHVEYVTTLPGYREQVAPALFHVVRDASRWDKIGLLKARRGGARIYYPEREVRELLNKRSN